MLNVFVACPYSPPPLEGYRDVYDKIQRAFPYVKFCFADEKINSDAILDRVVAYIREASVCACDITGWNANVTMELGLALGMGKRVQLLFLEQRRLFGRSQMSGLELPVNIRGRARMNYQDAASLQAGLRAFVQQEVANPDLNVASGALKALCESIYGLLGIEPGLKRFEIARHLGMETPDVRRPLEHLIREERIYQVGGGVNAQFYQKGYVRPTPPGPPESATIDMPSANRQTAERTGSEAEPTT